jgi:hypothetical protein
MTDKPFFPFELHGHIIARADGYVDEDCGGPHYCKHCQAEREWLRSTPWKKEQIEDLQKELALWLSGVDVACMRDLAVQLLKRDGTSLATHLRAERQARYDS